MLSKEEEVLSYMALPSDHWSRFHSSNPPKRLNKEIKRRTYVVGVFSDEPPAIRLVGSVPMEIADKRLLILPILARSRYDKYLTQD